MSRAFVDEDTLVVDLPDRPVSAHPNYVTGEGLKQLEASRAAAQRAYGKAQAAADRDALAKAARDLRYWDSRRNSAQLIQADPDVRSAQFGCRVSFRRGDGRRQTYRIVGEDEADPTKGTIPHVSPLARALLGRFVGDVIELGADEVEISQID